jgi:hypothetical protein
MEEKDKNFSECVLQGLNDGHALPHSGNFRIQ